MNSHRTIPLRFSGDMPTAKTILIPCESLPRLAGSSGPRPFNGSEDVRHARPPGVTIHAPEGCFRSAMICSVFVPVWSAQQAEYDDDLRREPEQRYGRPTVWRLCL